MSAAWIAAFVALWLITLLLAALVLGILRRVDRVLAHAEARVASLEPAPDFGLRAGQFIPAFRANDKDANPATSETVFSEAPTLVLFVEPGCHPCRELISDLKKDGWAVFPELLVIAPEEPGARYWLDDTPPGVTVLYEKEKQARWAFSNTVTPNAFLVGIKGLVIGQLIPGSLASLKTWATSVASQNGEVIKSDEHMIAPQGIR